MGNCSTNWINFRQIFKLSDISQFSLIQIKPFTLARQKLIDQKRVQLSISGKHNELLISSNNNINIINPSTSDLWSWQTLKLDGNLNKINDRCETKNRQFVDEKKFRKNFDSTGKMLEKYGNLKRNKSVFLLTSSFLNRGWKAKNHRINPCKFYDVKSTKKISTKSTKSTNW